VGTSDPAPSAKRHRAAAADAGQRPVIRVLLADDVELFRHTLATLLSLEADIEVAAELASGDQIVPAALQHRPDLALLDIDLPGTNGLAAAAELARRLPACNVLILTGLESSGYLEEALRAGARGILLKDGPADELIAGVRAAARGEVVIDSRLRGLAPDGGQEPGTGLQPTPTATF